MKLLVDENELTGIADAIREKTGKSDTIEFPSEFVSEIGSISGAQLFIDILARSSDITTIDNDEITTLGYMSMSSLSELTTVSLPNLTSSGTYVFNKCNKISSLYVPKLQTVNQYFITSNALETVAFPSAIKTEGNAIRGTSLLKVDFGENFNSLGNGCFMDSSSLNVIIIRNKNSVCSLKRTTDLENTAFGSLGAGGTLYVPNDLISTYQGATNWSTILAYPNNSIVKIEGSVYENYYADGTSVSS